MWSRHVHNTLPHGEPLIFQQAYMYLLLGNSHIESGDYKGAMHLFERAQGQMRNYVGPRLFAVSLVSFLRNIRRHVDNDRYLTDIRMEI